MVTEYFHFEQQSENPGGLAPGFSMPFFGVVAYSHRLVTLFVAIQPFADEVLNHTCHDGDCDGNEKIGEAMQKNERESTQNQYTGTFYGPPAPQGIRPPYLS